MSEIDGLEDFDSVTDDVPEMPEISGGSVPPPGIVLDDDEDDYLLPEQKPTTAPVRNPGKFMPPEIAKDYHKGLKPSPVLLPVSDEWVNQTPTRKGEAREPEWRTQIKQIMEMPQRDWGIFYIIMTGQQTSCHSLASQLRARKLKYPAGKFEFVSKNLYPDDPDPYKKKFVVLCKYWGPEEESA